MALNLPAKLSEIKESSDPFLVELYIMELRNGNLYLCAADKNITWNGQEFRAAPLQRDKVNASTDSKIDNCKLTISNTDAKFTVALYSGYDFRGCNCTIFQVPYPDCLTDTTLVKYIMTGYLDTPILTKDGTFTIEVNAQVPNLENYRTLGISCGNTYADQEGCFASLDTLTGTVQSGTTTNSIVIETARNDDWWANGIVTIGYESRMIESNTGNVIKIRYPFNSTPTGTYTITRNCSKTWTDCGNHSQQQNYSGAIGTPYETVVRSS